MLTDAPKTLVKEANIVSIALTIVLSILQSKNKCHLQFQTFFLGFLN